VPLPVLFKEPTIEALANYVDTTLWAAAAWQQGTAAERALQEDEEEISL
jgi:hypothetical protein